MGDIGQSRKQQSQLNQEISNQPLIISEESKRDDKVFKDQDQDVPAAIDPEMYVLKLDKVMKPGFPASPGKGKKILKNHQFYNSSKREQEDPEQLP